MLKKGDVVRLRNDPGRQGVLTGRNRPRADTVKYQVSFPEGKSYYPDYELEVDDDPDWEDLLESGRFGKVRDLRRNITHIHLSGRLADLVYSMDATNTDFYAYQYKPVLSFLDSPSKGLLIADEVGLGKTIEAGLIWTELRARYDARRLLVVCPAMLREKWKSELASRFGIDAEILDAGGLHSRLKERDRHSVPDGRGIICSLQGVRPPGTNKSEGKKAALRDFFDQMSEEEPLFDLVIIDEAHYLRNPETRSAKLGELLRDVTENLVLLSATPINLREDDLFHLLKLVDPDSFSDTRVFPSVLRANEHLVKARDLVRNRESTAEQISKELVTAQKHPLLNKSKQLEGLIDADLGRDYLGQDSDRIRLASHIEKINLLRHVVSRTRKSEVHEWQVTRRPARKFVEWEEGDSECSFYEGVKETIRNYADENDISDGFLLAGPLRQVCSCMYAAASGWKARDYTGLAEQYYEDFGEEDVDGDSRPLIERLCDEVLPGLDLRELRDSDSKYEQFKNAIDDYLRQHPDEKIIVFSFYRGTLDYLAERLEEDGIGSQVLVGGMAEPKHEVIERFREDKMLRILLSSEVASEGVDLQFCRVLVNYDLPWNPMKVEQRIGRIDRLGQQSESISIINLGYADTIDQQIHDRLYKRIGIFKRALGGMEAILGEEISSLTSDLLSKPLSREEEEARFSRTEMAIKDKKIKEEELESQASSLIAHGGYILDEVRAAHQFKKRITEADLVSYVKDYLDKYSQGHEFHQLEEKGYKFRIRLSPDMAASLAKYIKNKKLSGQTWLATGESLDCVFANKVRDVRYVRPKTEVISQFHPLIRFIGHDLVVKNEAFHRLVAATVSSENMENLTAGRYAFFVQRWGFKGIKTEEELRVRAMNLDTNEMLSAENSWNLMHSVRANGADWGAVKNTVDRDLLREALHRCEDELVENDYRTTKERKTNENKDRASFQIESAKKHCDRQLKSREGVLQRHREKGNTKMIRLEEGRIKKIRERFDVQVAKRKRESKLNGSHDDVCCGVILVT